MTHASSDNQGLICAFELDPVTVRDHELLEEKKIHQPQWLHFGLADTRARRWIESAGLPDEAREVLIDPVPRVHGQSLSNAVLLVLHDMHHDFKGDPESVAPLVIYVEERRVITGRRHALMSTDRLRRKLLAGTQVATVRTDTSEAIMFGTTDALPIVPCSLLRLGSMIDLWSRPPTQNTGGA